MTSFDGKWRPAKSFCDKMKPCSPANKVEFYAWTRFFPTFSPFFDNIPEVFQPILLLSAMQCVQDIRTNNAYFLKKSFILRVVMITTAFDLAKPKRGKTTLIRRWSRDILVHFPNSNVKIGGTVCKLYQIYHIWTFFVIKSLKHKITDFF